MEQSERKTGEPFIQVENLYFSYDRQLLLEDITFTISEGDFLAIIGPNGSGKSTLVKIILKLLKPDKGTVRIQGVPIDSFNRWDLVGYVPQKATHVDALFPISVSEVVGLERLAAKRCPKWLGRKDSLAVTEALDLVGMASQAGRRIGDLSGGQQQRVFIARAIVNRPRILFLDEPTTGIDSKAQDEFYSLLDTLNRQGITVVMITHDIGVVNKHVNKVACLNRRMVFHGTHEEFCSSADVQALIPGEHHLILHRH
jgi:zinc transport system ATP-binding protein